MVYEEHDEEVQEAEELEERAHAVAEAGGSAATQADRDDEIKPYVHRCSAEQGGWMGGGRGCRKQFKQPCRRAGHGCCKVSTGHPI